MPDEKLPPKRSAPPDAIWRGTQSGPANRSEAGSRRRAHTAILAGIFLALAAFAVVWLLTLRAPPAEPYFLIINIGDYNSDRYPTVAFAKQDAERLGRHFEHKRDAESKTKALLIQELGKLAAHAGKPLVLQISALALVRGGKVHILPADADPDDPATWLPLEAVLEAVGRCHEPRLLILDLAHPLADAKLGVLDDRVAEHVDDHLKKNPPGFPVLCACSRGQHSQTSEILQSGALAYYLDKGLQGEADGWGADGRIDLAISVKELFAYAADRVNRWSHMNRQALQQPQLFGPAEDFTLVNLQRSFKPKEYKVEPAVYPKPLKEGWETRDNLGRIGNRAFAEILRDLDGQLLRQEKRWMGGADVDEARITRTMQSARTAADAWRGPNMTPFFLGLAVPENKGSELLTNTIRNFLSRVVDKEDNQVKLQEIVKKRLDDEYKDIDSPQMTWAVNKALAQSGALQESQVRLAMSIAALRPAAKTGFMETLYLQRMADLADRLKEIGWNWRPAAVQQVLKTMRAQEAAIAELVQSPAQLRFVKSLIEEADSIRQTAEQKILWAAPSGWDDARKQLITAEEKYASAQRLVENLSRCENASTEAQVFLTELAPLLCDWPEYDGDAIDSWQKAADHQSALAQSLRDLGDDPQRAANQAGLVPMNNHRFELAKHMTALTETLRGRIDRVAKRTGADVLQQARCLLDSSALSAKDRTALRDRAAELAKALQAKTDHEDEDNNRGGTALAALPRPRYPWDAVKRANLRGDVAMALIQPPLPRLPPISKTDQIDAFEVNVQKTLAEAGKKAAIDAQPPLPPWKELVGWLEKRYRQEGDLLLADESKERVVIGEFYRDLARNLARLR